MQKIIAVCTDTEIFNENKMFNPDFAKNYFGLLTMSYFAQMLPEFKVVTADVALKMLQKKEIAAKNILVFQEQDAKSGEMLIKKGAFAHTIYCYESLIYARSFYEKLKTMPAGFLNRIFFSGMFDSTENCNSENNFKAHFPSFDDDEILAPKPWEKRDFASLVMGNKFYVGKDIFPRKIRFKKILNWFIYKYIRKEEADKYIEKHELQNKRLEIIEFFAKNGLLNLYGGGWDYLDNLPLEWENRLEASIKKLSPKPVDDKLVAISACKFNFCLENLSYKGYITEKIIHSFVAGSIPVYLGAPDIEKFIPAECFIDARKFASIKELNDFLQNITKEQGEEYINLGRKFLFSEEGQKYSFKNNAKLLADLARGQNVR